MTTPEINPTPATSSIVPKGRKNRVADVPAAADQHSPVDETRGTVSAAVYRIQEAAQYRRFFLKLRNRVLTAVHAKIRGYLGWRPKMEEAAAVKLVRRAEQIVEAVRKGKIEELVPEDRVAADTHFMMIVTALRMAKPAEDELKHLHRQGSTVFRRAVPDRRSTEGRFMAAYEEQLVRHVGGAPSPVEARIIERAAMVALHIWRLDQQAQREGGLPTEKARDYADLNNSLVRILKALNKAPKPAPKTEPPKTAEKKSRRHRPVKTIADLLVNPT